MSIDLENSDYGWISVKDRFPEYMTKVLVFVKYEIIIDYISFPKDGNLWNLISKELITHWMPLPKPPKDES